MGAMYTGSVVFEIIIFICPSRRLLDIKIFIKINNLTFRLGLCDNIII